MRGSSSARATTGVASASSRSPRSIATSSPGFARPDVDGHARHAHALEPRGRRAHGGAGAFCIHEEMMRLTFRIVGLTLFSSDVDGDAKDVGQALEVAMHWANDYAESIVRDPPSIPTPANLRFKRAKKHARRRRLPSHRGAPRERAAHGRLRRAISSASSWPRPRRGGGVGSGMNDQQLRDEIITMILAGHETTANLLSWTFHLLAKHPDVERRVREEAERVLGDREPVLEDMKALELHAHGPRGGAASLSARVGVRAPGRDRRRARRLPHRARRDRRAMPVRPASTP